MRGKGCCRAFRVGNHLCGNRVVKVDNPPIRLRKQQRLCLAVFLHRTVEIQVILGQVGEQRHLEADAVNPLERQRVGGNLHHGMGAARVAHPRKERLQFVGFGGGALGLEHLVPD